MLRCCDGGAVADVEAFLEEGPGVALDAFSCFTILSILYLPRK